MKKIRLYGFGAGVAMLLCVAFFAHAAVPSVINYQSRLRTTAGAPITTATKVSFSLYSASTGGTALWTEIYSQSSGACAKVTPDSNGYFSVQMGNCDAFPSTLTFTTPLYLGVTIENDAEATPRVAFAPAPYAMNAVRVGNFVSDTSVNTLTGESMGTATAVTQGFNSSGLVLQGSGWSGSTAQSKGFKLRTTATDASNYRLSVLDSGDGSESVSILNNGRVGIGITNPQSELEVAGVIYANDFRTRGGSISTTGDGVNDLIRFTRPKLLIGYTASLSTPGPVTNLIEFTPSGISFLEDVSFSKLLSVPARQIKFGVNTFTFPVAAPASNGLVLTTDADGTLSWTAKSSGSVTSVGLSAPSGFAVSGSPVTASGTLAFSWQGQQPNEILAGPSSGASVGEPTFRALVTADIPNLDASKITTGVIGTARGGTGISTYARGQIVYSDAINSLAALGIGANGTVLTVNGTTGLPEWKSIPVSTGGTVTSVAATVPSFLTVIGTPITDSGTLAIDLASQAQGGVFAGPISGADAKPSFRGLTSTDIPSLDAAKIISGIFGIGRIPDIDASKITTGVFAAARIPTLGVAQIPNLDASKITTGTFDLARIPDIPIVQGGTGISSVAVGDVLYGDAINSLARLGIGANGTVLTVNGTTGLPEWKSIPASSGGTVTSVGLSLPSLFGVSGSPVTSSGTVAISLENQNANMVFAGPVINGILPEAPTFRALAPADIPDLNASKITAGVVGVVNGGTGLSSYSPKSLIYAQSSTTLAGIAAGASGSVLTIVGGVPAWSSPASGVGGSGVFGQLAFWNASSTLTGNPKMLIDNTNGRLAVGTSTAPVTTLVVGGDTTFAGDVVPSETGAFDLGSPTKRIRNAYIDDLYIYGGPGGSGTSTISATQTIFNGITYTWPSAGSSGSNFVLISDTNGNLDWRDPVSIVPESGWRSLAGNVRLGVPSDKVGIGTALPATKLDVVGDIQASGFLSSASGQIKFGGATYSFPTVLPSSGQILSASSTAGSLQFRSLTAADIPAVGSSSIPNLDASKITTGVFPVARGGTGLSSVGADGQVLTVVGGVPAWQAVGGLSAAAVTVGRIPYLSATGILSNSGFIKNATSTEINESLSVKSSLSDGSYVRLTTAGEIYQNSPTNLSRLLVDAYGSGTFRNITAQGALSALATSTLANVIPAMDNVYDLGSPTARWRDIYVGPATIKVINNSGQVIESIGEGSGTNSGKLVVKGSSGERLIGGLSGSGLPASVAVGTALLSPIGSAGAPAFRALTALDIPSLDVAKLTSGTLPVARGGTGLSSVGTDGQVLTVVGGVPAWTAASGEGAIYTGNKTIVGNLNVNSGSFVMNGNVIIDSTLNVNLQRLNVVAGATINSSLKVRDVIPLADNLYPLGSPANRFSALHSVSANIESLVISTNAGVGKVLTSDAVGNASWQLPAEPAGLLPAGGGDFNVLTSLNGVPTWHVPAVSLPAGGTAGQVIGVDPVTGVKKWGELGAIVGKYGFTMAGDTGNTANRTVLTNRNIQTPSITVTGTPVGSLNRTLPALNIDQASISSEIASNVLNFTLQGAAKMALKTTGLEVTGTVKSNGLTLTSDARLKKNVVSLKGGLDVINKLNPVAFDWKDGQLAASVGRQIGFVAQDVEKLLPEVVSTDDNGYKSLAYGNMSALAIQGVKELDAKLKAPMTLSGTTSVAGAVLPTEDNVYDLGSPDKRFKSIYLGPGTIYMMQDNGTQVSLGFSEEGINKDKFVLRGSDGKEVVLTGGSGGGSCGLLCSVLTARVVDGRAQLAPAVPDVDLGIATNRLRTVFADTVNVSAITFPMETRELATASVGKTLGVISADGVSARIGLVDSMDARTDVLVADMARAKNDIAMLKAQLASVQAALAMKVKEVGVCRSESIPVLITKTVGSGDWVILQATPPIF